MKIQRIYTSRDGSERLAERQLSGKEKHEQVLLTIYPDKTRQEILGFGGAFTDTAAMALSHMEEEIQKNALKAYFDSADGLAYNMGRIPIGCCDFSSVPYSHAETPGDKALDCYSIEQDRKGILPFIQKAKEYMKKNKEMEELLLYALPWSPPGWMKTNGQMSWGGKLKREYYGTMASYLVRFIQAYEKEGVRLWGIAAQNEPIEVQRWASCEFTGEEERIFLKRYLIPAMEAAGYGDRKILCWECNKDFMRERAEEILTDEVLGKKVFGIGFHWYSGDFFEELEKTHQEFPGARLLATECCVVMPEDLQEWSVGERYAHDMIGDLNQWTCAWFDWNLFLDQKSGPQIADNLCAAPIILDEEKQRMIFMPSYYYIGHFSRYIKRGARGVEIVFDKKAGKKGMEGCAFLNPNGEIAVVLMNPTEDEICGCMRIGNELVAVELDPHSIETILI